MTMIRDEKFDVRLAHCLVLTGLEEKCACRFRSVQMQGRRATQLAKIQLSFNVNPPDAAAM